MKQKISFKKSISILLIISLIMAFGSFTGLAASKINTANEIVAKKVVSNMVIDGKLNDSAWNINTKVTRSMVGKADNTVSFGVLWDSKYLYIGVKVLDSKLYSNDAQREKNDSVAIMIDAYNDSNHSDSKDRQFTKGYNTTTNDLLEKHSDRLAGNHTEGVMCEWAAIKGGYTVEMAMPWSNPGIEPDTTEPIGLFIGNNDNDSGKGRDSQLVWPSTGDIWDSMLGQCYLSAQTAGKAAKKTGPVFKQTHVYNPVPVENTTLLDLSGKKVSFEDFKGKKVYMTFFATWCQSCRSELPSVEEIYKTKGKDVVVLGIDFGEDRQTVKTFMDQNNYQFPVLLDSDTKFSKKYARDLPASMFLDKNGSVMFQFGGIMDDSQMQYYLNKIK